MNVGSSLQPLSNYQYLQTRIKKTVLFILFGFLTVGLFAQEDSDDEYELRGNEKPGYVIDKKGKKHEGIVKLVDYGNNPWDNQRKVKFIALEDIDKNKKRQKFKTWDVDDLNEYVAYEDDVERRFELIKYTNVKEGMKTNTSGLSGEIKSFKNLTKSRQLAEVSADGKIKVYKLYGYPTSFAAGHDQIKKMHEENERLRNNPTYIYSKNGSKLNELSYSEISDLVGDCSYVKNKIENGSYNTIKAEDGKKRKGLGKLIKTEVDNAMANIPGIIEEVITDYNLNCP